jgi:hypothetical protein
MARGARNEDRDVGKGKAKDDKSTATAKQSSKRKRALASNAKCNKKAHLDPDR